MWAPDEFRERPYRAERCQGAEAKQKINIRSLVWSGGE
jgi:hypothetical protein